MLREPLTEGLEMKVVGGGVRVAVFLVDEKGRHKGKLEMVQADMDPESMSIYAVDNQDCIEDIQTLSQQFGIEPKAWMVTSSEIVPGLWGKGYGVELYVEAAKWAAKQGGMIIMNECEEDEGSTSDAAYRVWRSKRFRSQVTVGPNGAAAYAS